MLTPKLPGWSGVRIDAPIEEIAARIDATNGVIPGFAASKLCC